MRRFFAIDLILAVLLLCLCTPAGAQGFIEKLMMPGELSEPHAKLEENCSNCHKTLDRQAQSGLCLSCHKTVQADVSAKSGFHGKDPMAQVSECAACHADHQGRNHSLVPLKPVIFNHDNTDYPLAGRHRTATCEGCHIAGKRFSEAPHDCLSCHAAHQPHAGRLGERCASCHVVDGWAKVAAFNHEKTAFPLRGAHVSVACLSCHVSEVYKGVGTACNDCHAIQDVHATRFGPACQDCHGVERWKGAKFDHAKKTRFALLGAHEKATCSACHGADTRAKISMACFDCHQAQDVHKAKLGNHCADCHGETAWRDKVRFDHGLTTYPLLGLHVAVACESCHDSQAFQGAPTNCAACHAGDDPHIGRFTSRCESCHSANGWARVTFDHRQNTHFPLTGAHSKVGCYGCHAQKNVASAALSTTCYACHRSQDVHHGAYGQDCARCHSTATFRTAFIRK